MRYVLFKVPKEVQGVKYNAGDAVQIANSIADDLIVSGEVGTEGQAWAAISRGAIYRVHEEEKAGGQVETRTVLITVARSYGEVPYDVGEVVELKASDAASAISANVALGEASANIAIAAGAKIRNNRADQLVSRIFSVFSYGIWYDAGTWNDLDIWKD